MPRLTMVPLPEWRDLLSAMLKSPLPNEMLAAPWCGPGEEAYWLSQSAWSLAIIARWRQQLGQKANVTVWIPDFFCNASLAPLRSIGAKLVFYPVTDQLRPDVDACRNLAREQSPDIVVLVHYFGQPVAAESIAVFCKERGAWLIEDATHVLRPVPGIGQTGDCVIYSPHKHLPIPDGAILIARPDGPARLAELAHAMRVLRKVSNGIIELPHHFSMTAAIWLLKRVLQRFGLRSRRSVLTFRAEAKITAQKTMNPRMSAMSRRLLSCLIETLDDVAGCREQRSKDWRSAMLSADISGSLIPLPSNATPYFSGFMVGKETGAEAIFERLQHAGLPVTTWPDLPPEVVDRADAHRVAIELRNTHLYLPAHQTLDPLQIFNCSASLLNEATTQWQVRALLQDEWEGYWKSCPNTNLLQSWQYGSAKELVEGWKPQRLLITNEHGHPVALAQVLTRGLPFLGGIARINRGPLPLMDLTANAEIPVKLAAILVLLREARRQRWWAIQIAPELPPTKEARVGMQSLGFKNLPLIAWGSGRISLEVNESALLMGLNGKWRNCMRKGERLGVFVMQYDGKGEEIDLLMSSYEALQSKQGFEGISQKLIRALAMQQGRSWEFNLFIARSNGDAADEEPLGLLVTVRSGDTTIYLIGYTNDKGRKVQANSVLLWQAILHAKKSGCVWFDIGGLNEATPKGIAEFKQGLNATPYELAGEWRKW